jgi:hypothetical protein
MPPLKEQSGLPAASAVARKKYDALSMNARVVGRELRAGETFKAVGDPAALELILQPAVLLVIHGAIGHHSSP